MPQKIVVVGAGPVGSLAALYAAVRGHEVHIYELRSGRFDRVLKTNHIVADVR
jgi:2-polyprenyl-6-methoxyphenol hydroxylase-like FAD-dependent oxidoreductase